MEVKYSNPPIKLYVTVGTVGLLSIIVSMFLFPMIWTIGLSALFACITLIVSGKVLVNVLGVYHTLSIQRIERRHAKFMQVDRTKSLYSISDGLVIPAYNEKKPLTLPAKLMSIDAEIEKPKELFDLLDLYPHLMLIAPSGSGKTTQLSMVASYLLRQKVSKLIWMSTHALEDKVLIPTQAIVMQSVDEIVSRLNEIVILYKKRRDNPQANYCQVIIVIDEWYDLSMEDGDIHKAISQLSSGARKFGIVLILASHTDNVSDTGLNKNLRRNFGRVRLDANLTKQKKAIWMMHDKQSSWQKIVLPDIEVLFKSLIEGGLSKNKAAKACYNGRPYGGNLSRIE